MQATETQGNGRVAPMGVAQALALATIALVPLIPRPTFEGAIGVVPLIAPIVSLVIFFFACVHYMTRQRTPTVPGVPLYVAILATAIYGGRVIWNGENEELTFLASRVLLILVVVACCIVFSGDRFEIGLRWFMRGALVLSALVLLIGVTGLSLLEPALPGRTLGIPIPFFKTAGVPRSFGEQGVLLSLMLAYFLVYRRSMRRWMRWALGVSCVLVLVMAQSRNVLLGAVAVPVMWWAVAYGRWLLVRLGLVAAGLATFVMEQVLPLLQDTALGKMVIGQGIFERNVEARFTLVDGALAMINSDPVRALVGWPHAAWNMSSPVEIEAGVHNHFVSSILFLGIIGGALTIWGLYVLPLSRVVADLSSIDSNSDAARRRQFAITAAAGVLVCVNFYEGFFSLSLAVAVGILWMLMMDKPGTSETTVPERVSKKTTTKLPPGALRSLSR